MAAAQVLPISQRPLEDGVSEQPHCAKADPIAPITSRAELGNERKLETLCLWYRTDLISSGYLHCLNVDKKTQPLRPKITLWRPYA